ncbi:MAG: class I SAM-dependent methyltransferase, partial [Candidatus Omnitrophota bacterium]
GKLLFYDESGAADVVGIDIRLQSVNSAMQLHMKRAHNVIKVLNSDSAYMPFPSNYFDVIISINVLEHVDNIRATMLECKRVLRPDGIIFLHFPPFYSPWGAHLEGWINFPWPHVLFRDSQLLEAAQWFEDKKKNNKEYIFSANVDWLKHSQLPELNRTTIDQFEKLLRDVELKILHTDLLPFGRHYLQKFGLIGKIIFRLLKILTILPGLREIVTTKMVFIITK